MARGVIWSSELEELKRVLRLVPEQFAEEAKHHAEDFAQGAAVAVKQVYGQHWVTGNLQSRVYASPFSRGKFVGGWEVKALAHHTWLFEHTSKPRFYVTKPGSAGGGGGKIHATGRMWKGNPPAQTFIPTMIRFRRAYYERLKEMVRRAGFQVSGDAAA